MKHFIEYIPIATTCLSFIFFKEILSHYNSNKKSYLLWWTIGVLTFGLGTLSESINVLFGWNEYNLRFWYIIGALLGGFPLAQGSVYLLMSKRFANTTTLLFISVIAIASIAVIMTPIDLPDDFDGRLTGAVFGWKWVRYFSPFINLYSFIFLVGGAIFSAIRYYQADIKDDHFIGNIFIAVGALLPGIGGTFTRMGYVEVLFITELIGLAFIYYAYVIIKNIKHKIPV